MVKYRLINRWNQSFQLSQPVYDLYMQRMQDIEPVVSTCRKRTWAAGQMQIGISIRPLSSTSA